MTKTIENTITATEMKNPRRTVHKTTLDKEINFVQRKIQFELIVEGLEEPN